MSDCTFTCCARFNSENNFIDDVGDGDSGDDCGGGDVGGGGGDDPDGYCHMDDGDIDGGDGVLMLLY